MALENISNDNFKKLLRLGVPLRDVHKEVEKMQKTIASYSNQITILKAKLKVYEEAHAYEVLKLNTTIEIINKPV